jgi:tRNA uridine 5-carboxymethylaminomethyl modification enzyme
MFARLNKKETHVTELIAMAAKQSLSPEEVNPYLESKSEGSLGQSERISRLLKRPGVQLDEILKIGSLVENPTVLKMQALEDSRLKHEILEQVEIDLKYEGYIQREREQIERFDRLEDQMIPIDFEYSRIKSLSTEGREKLSKVKPESIGQASRISGVTPSDVSILMISLRA